MTTDDREGRIRRSLLGAPPWLVETYGVEAGRVKLSGWAIPPDGLAENWTFFVNGRSPDVLRWPLATPSLNTVFWFCPGAGKAGFVIEFTLTGTDRFAEDVEVEFVNTFSRMPLSAYSSHFLELDPTVRIPDGDRLLRTQGNRSPQRYALHGYTTFRRVKLAIYKHSGRRLDDFLSILDWGCGCGRLTQHLVAGLGKSAVHGVDIDESNVEWCRENIEGARFDVVPTRPPTDIESGSYDLLVGISVMTHLDNAMQRSWLGELRRLAKPDAYILLTTHGESALARVKNFDVVKQALKTGMDDSTSDTALTSIIDDGEYYRSSYHLQHYAEKVFGYYFEVIEIIRSANASLQDIVVLRKPAERAADK